MWKIRNLDNQLKLESILAICNGVLSDDELMSSPYNTTLKLVMKSIKRIIDNE